MDWQALPDRFGSQIPPNLCGKESVVTVGMPVEGKAIWRFSG